MNTIHLSGHITEPESRSTANGTAVCNFRMAVRRNRKDKDGEYPTDWFSVVAYGQRAEFISRYCRKGNKLEVLGRMEMRKYTDKNGVERTVYEVIVSDVENHSPREQNAPQSEYEPDMSGFGDLDDSEGGLPF